MESIDHYKYPGEDVLINEFDCHDVKELSVLEALSTAETNFKIIDFIGR